LNAFESLTAETLMVFLPAAALVAWGTTRSTSVTHVASSGQWMLVLFTGVVTAVPLLMFAIAAPRMQLSVMALLQYIVPTINFFLGWLAYHEQLTTNRVVGFGLVWIGLALVSADSLRRSVVVQRNVVTKNSAIV
jgi:chloramphenicol-sensitive protein RarD